jgi:hypothetical protein
MTGEQHVSIFLVIICFCTNGRSRAEKLADTAAISGAFFGALSAPASAAGCAFAFQRSLAINAVLMPVCIALSVTLVRHQQVAHRRARQDSLTRFQAASIAVT